MNVKFIRLVCYTVLFLTFSALRAADLTLFETPDSKEAPVLDAINGAVASVRVVVYQLTAEDVVKALIAAHNSGRMVQVILNQGFYKGNVMVYDGGANAKTFKDLNDAGVEVHWAVHSFLFTHEKAIIVDAGRPTQEVLVMTLNLCPSYMGLADPSSNDSISLNFGVIDSFATDVAEAMEIFQDDWTGAAFSSASLGDLVLSPVNSRTALEGQLRDAKHSISIFAQELSDKSIVALLVTAARAGRTVRCLIADAPPSIKDANENALSSLKGSTAEIRFLHKPYEHAKATITDGALVYIGSINYTPSSMDKNRELGILTADHAILTTMNADFESFWKQGTPVPTD